MKTRVIIQAKYSVFLSLGVTIFSVSVCQADRISDKLRNVQYSFNPNFVVKQSYNDNLLLTENNQVSSMATLMAPSLIFTLNKNNNSASFRYLLEKNIVYKSHADDFQDHTLGGDLNIQLSRQNNITFLVDYQRRHEDRGTGYSRGIGSQLIEPDKFRHYNAGTMISYGTLESIGRIEFQFNAFAKRLDGRPEAGVFANQNNYSGRLSFFYRIRPNTSLLVEAYRANVNFVNLNPSNSLDNQLSRLYLGGRWDITALTTGDVKLGLLKKDFNNQKRTEFVGVTWNIHIKITPLPSTQLELSTISRTEETTGLGDYTETTTVATSIIYHWNIAWRTVLDASAEKKIFKPTAQAQGIWSIGITIDYKFNQWLDLSTSLLHKERLSTIVEQDYQRNIFSLSLKINTNYP